ncbi:hypothetical protein SIN8267_02527 [Sinobacterium norvegicum]|uniref:MAPEG family protein n=1 Tax=Sinobacterium norvegicum TaxID=1641715 RepID=A0ABN8EN84_9GAMM|nr:MAPEG family protein [Sinobacterium norvegicum]CAH0992407.1 hypothetical protein SIN8267_02527 [Sinobacterium norvegicum]
MPLLQDYHTALFGFFVIVLTLIVQTMVAAFSKASMPGAVPGKIDASLSHESFVFRANRTVANSLENVPAILGSFILAVLSGADAQWTAIFVWLYALARLLHMVLYYVIATEKNPSPRSYFYLLGVIATLGLLITGLLALL